ncbi:MAG TPA: RNA 3'-terminal phosphate cyclase [Planctomycetota bacterium]
MVNLDGSVGEGGGQMLRTALVWSLITQTPFTMVKIRENRDKPGLKAQHLNVLKALRVMGPVGITGDQIGSRSVSFYPAALKAVDATVDVGTAGSLTLLLQTLLPVVLTTPGRSRFRLIGGTDVQWSPTIDYLRNVVAGPAMLRAKLLKLDLVSRGYYPAGGGEILFEAEGWKDDVPPLERLERGRLVQIRVLASSSRALEERRVAERMAASASETLRRFRAPVHEEVTYGDTRSPSCSITCVADFAGGQKLGGSALGERGRSAEDVGKQAADQLAKEIDSNAPVDEFAADQLVPWLAMSGGAYRASVISEHTRTNVMITERFLGSVIEIEGDVVRCRRPFAGSSRAGC